MVSIPIIFDENSRVNSLGQALAFNVHFFTILFFLCACSSEGVTLSGYEMSSLSFVICVTVQGVKQHRYVAGSLIQCITADIMKQKVQK